MKDRIQNTEYRIQKTEDGILDIRCWTLSSEAITKDDAENLKLET